MATTSHIDIYGPGLELFDHPKIDPQSAQKASEVLQENHDIHHIFFNLYGLHNHIVHHITTILALGASPDVIERHYLKNKSYQIPPGEKEDGFVQSLSDPLQFKKFLGDNKHYLDYAEFFRQEIDQRGYEAVVNRYLFQGDELADNMLEKFFTFHPLIHLGCGIELNQPAIIVEALALTAVHSNRLPGFHLFAEKAPGYEKSVTDVSLVDLVQAVGADQIVQNSLSWSEPKKFENGPVNKGAKDIMLKYAGMWNVGPGQLQEKMAEVINGAAFVAGAAQRPPKIVKLDFFLIHGLTTCHSLLVLLEQPWISDETKVRMVEWMGRLELAAYASLGVPKLYLNEILDYLPKHPSEGWESLIKRATEVEDDGHTSKVIRALIHGQQVSKPFEDRPNFMVKGDMWMKIGHMCLDSVENTETRWVRIAGFAEAWEALPDRSS